VQGERNVDSAPARSGSRTCNLDSSSTLVPEEFRSQGGTVRTRSRYHGVEHRGSRRRSALRAPPSLAILVDSGATIRAAKEWMAGAGRRDRGAESDTKGGIDERTDDAGPAHARSGPPARA
jgi:hypothetical protein